MIRRVPEITIAQENFRLEPVPGLRALTIRRDPVEPVPVGAYVARVFRVTGYDPDCDGSLMARLECVDADGEPTGWKQASLGLYPASSWVLDSPDELDRRSGIVMADRARLAAALESVDLEAFSWTTDELADALWRVLAAEAGE